MVVAPDILNKILEKVKIIHVKVSDGEELSTIIYI
jgi:hypothetical protein